MVLNVGVRFEQRMTFSRHADDVTQKCVGLLCGLNHSQHCLHESTLVMIVQSLVVSRIRYCLIAYVHTQCMECVARWAHNGHSSRCALKPQ